MTAITWANRERKPYIHLVFLENVGIDIEIEIADIFKCCCLTHSAPGKSNHVS